LAALLQLIAAAAIAPALNGPAQVLNEGTYSTRSSQKPLRDVHAVKQCTARQLSVSVHDTVELTRFGRARRSPERRSVFIIHFEPSETMPAIVSRLRISASCAAEADAAKTIASISSPVKVSRSSNAPAMASTAHSARACVLSSSRAWVLQYATNDATAPADKQMVAA
jgi:hypothetical protein